MSEPPIGAGAAAGAGERGSEQAHVPMFVVVGNVNQGKSSIVATLAEDETVPISPAPGTTVRTGEYAFRLGERTVFRLIDTPGFQQARAVLEWMRGHSRSAADRRQVVQQFVREHQKGGEFPDEVQLLRPILDGASILYVVDASARFQPSSEAEMEILRWTGQPGMALVNRTRERDHADEWRPILQQFFNVVREFNAHKAGFPERIGLLEGFREVRDEWRRAMDEAIAAMRQDWEARRRRAAAVIGDLMVRALVHVEKQRLADGGDTAALRAELQRAYESSQREREKRARVEVEHVYGHRRVVRRESELGVLAADLFSDTSWQLFGLTRWQLAKHGALWGGVAGLAIDLMVGGLSVFAGAGIGAGVGAAAGWFGGTEIARTWGDRSKLAQALFPGDTGHFLAIGPVTSPRYAWLLLDRALVHYRAVRDRSHARQDPLELTAEQPGAGGAGGAAGGESGGEGSGGGKAGVVAALASDLRRDVDDGLREVLKAGLRGDVGEDVRSRLVERLDRVLRAV